MSHIIGTAIKKEFFSRQNSSKILTPDWLRADLLEIDVGEKLFYAEVEENPILCKIPSKKYKKVCPNKSYRQKTV